MTKQISFNQSPYVGTEKHFIEQAIENKKLSGDGFFTKQCQKRLEELTQSPKVLLTSSCTHALEIAALLLDIQEDDEIIMPSYTFVSTANAFVLRGAKIKFIDIRPDTLNLDETLIESAITSKTRAIVPVHYAGVGCEMDKILEIARKYNLYVIEDAAQGFMSSYKGKALGTLGDIGCFSFHDTKNYTSGGEGGAILINNPILIARAEILREKGTDRSAFLRNEIDKYTWRDIGSSYLMSEIQAAYLYAQILYPDIIQEKRLHIWNTYQAYFQDKLKEQVQLSRIPMDCQHNAHLFALRILDQDLKTKFMGAMKNLGISCATHYVPLHTSPMGLKCGQFIGLDQYTTELSNAIVRLPLHQHLSNTDLQYICSHVLELLGE